MDENQINGANGFFEPWAEGMGGDLNFDQIDPHLHQLWDDGAASQPVNHQPFGQAQYSEQPAGYHYQDPRAGPRTTQFQNATQSQGTGQASGYPYDLGATVSHTPSPFSYHASQNVPSYMGLSSSPFPHGFTQHNGGAQQLPASTVQANHQPQFHNPQSQGQEQQLPASTVQASHRPQFHNPQPQGQEQQLPASSVQANQQPQFHNPQPQGQEQQHVLPPLNQQNILVPHQQQQHFGFQQPYAAPQHRIFPTQPQPNVVQQWGGQPSFSVTAQPAAAQPPAQGPATLAVPDQWLRAVPGPVGQVTNNFQRWAGMRHAVVSRTMTEADLDNRSPFNPVYVRTEKRRLFSQRPLLIPAEAMSRYVDGMCQMSKDDPLQTGLDAGRKLRVMRLALEYNLGRIDYPLQIKENKLKEEVKRRTKEEPANPPALDELSEVECKTKAILDLPSTWPPEPGLIRRVAADFTKFFVEEVSRFRHLPIYKDLSSAVKTKAGTELINKLKIDAEASREFVRRIIATALREADDRVIEALDPLDMKYPFQIVIHLFNAGDVNAPLTKSLLEFAGRLPSFDRSLIEEFKWLKLLPKLEEQGDAEVKAAVRKIKEVVKSNEGKPPLVNSAPDPKAASKISSSKAAASGSLNGMGKGSTGGYKPTGALTSKRPRDDDGEGRGTKKPATEQRMNNSQSSSQGPSQRTTTPSVPAKTSSSTQASTLKVRASTGSLPGKSRAVPKSTAKLDTTKAERPDSEANKHHGATQPPPSSTSKFELPKPSSSATSTVTTEPSRMASNPKKEDSKPEAPRSSGFSSSFSALMSEIEKPKPAKRPSPTPKPEPKIDETDEERERRLRKEKRRQLNLRVTFKSEPNLTSVRIFHKDEDENEQLDNHMIRDANDDKAEGRLLKASRSSQITSDREWEEPTLIDFTTIPEEQRKKTFVTRGGHIKVETNEQKVMAEKEKTELMVVYTDQADIPPSAMSPRAETGPDGDETGVELPGNKNLVNRASLFMGYGAPESVELLWKRKTAATTSVASMIVKKVQDKAPYQNYGDEKARQAQDEQVLQALTSPAATNYTDPEPNDPQLASIRRDYSDPKVQRASLSLEAVVAGLAGLPAPANEPPKWQTDQKRRAEWMAGYQEDQRREEAARQAQHVAYLSQAYNTQPAQNAYAQYYQAAFQAVAPQQTQQQQQPAATDPFAGALAALQATTAQPAQAAQPDQLQALMAAFGNQAAPQQQQQAQQANLDPAQALQLAMWAAAAAAGGGQQQQYAQAGGYGQDTGGGSSSSAQQHDRNRAGSRRGGKDGGNDEDHLRGINRSLIGTKPCTFWARGNCNRGDKCTFRHD